MKLRSISAALLKTALAAFLVVIPLGAAPAGEKSDKELRAKLKDYVRAVKFFESGLNIPDANKRVYLTRFASGLTRFINWELNFQMPALGRSLEYEVEAVWKKADGSVLARRNQKSYIEAAWTTPFTCHGWGNRVWGFWQPGSYTVELFIDKKQAAKASFEVVSDSDYGLQLTTLWDARVPLYPGSNVVSSEEQRPGATLCRARVETDLDKTSALYFFRERLKTEGWVFDTELLADTEGGSQKDNDLIWGMVNMVKDPYTLTVVIPSDKKTGGGRTLADLNLSVGASKADPAAFIDGVVKAKMVDSQMNRRFTNKDWAVTVLSAKAEGPVITKNFPAGGTTTFKVQTPNLYLIRVTVLLERLDGKAIKNSFILQPAVVDTEGMSYDCAATGTEGGEYYDFTTGGSQSLLTPMQPQDKLEYVFAVPAGAVINELDWPDLPPIKIRVR